MYGQGANSDHAKRLRKRGGAYLRALRENAELTQKAVADALGIAYYTQISAMEKGSQRPPTYHYETLARLFGVEVNEFAKVMLMFYDPFVYKCLWGLPGKSDLSVKV